jgi:hypothetical protein
MLSVSPQSARAFTRLIRGAVGASSPDSRHASTPTPNRRRHVIRSTHALESDPRPRQPKCVSSAPGGGHTRTIWVNVSCDAGIFGALELESVPLVAAALPPCSLPAGCSEALVGGFAGVDLGGVLSPCLGTVGAALMVAV